MDTQTRKITITAEDFLADPHAAKYRDIVDGYPGAFARVLQVLNDPDRQEGLAAAERFDRPALSGIVHAIEADPEIAIALESQVSLRFRQTVGVAVRLIMEELGWATTGKKGSVRGAKYFRRAERYEAPKGRLGIGGGTDRAREGLEAVASIGDDAERIETARELTAALAHTRRSENRPF